MTPKQEKQFCIDMTVAIEEVSELISDYESKVNHVMAAYYHGQLTAIYEMLDYFGFEYV